MNYVGIKKPEDRAAMVAWLNTLGSNKPAPSASQIAAEQAELALPEPVAEAVETAVETVKDVAADAKADITKSVVKSTDGIAVKTAE